MWQKLYRFKIFHFKKICQIVIKAKERAAFILDQLWDYISRLPDVLSREEILKYKDKIMKLL